MSDIIALDVSMGHSYCVVYRDNECIEEFNFKHDKVGFERLLDVAGTATSPRFFFEATGIYSRPIERFCLDNKVPYALLNPLELHMKTENLRRLKSDKNDAHKIATSAYENNYRMKDISEPEYTRIKGLGRSYQKAEKFRKLISQELHAELQQTFPELERFISNKSSILWLNVVSIFPHPDLVLNLSQTKLRNILIDKTDKKISKNKALKYAEKLLSLAKNSRPSARVDDPQIQDVKDDCVRLIELTLKKKSLSTQMVTLGKSLPEFDIIASVPSIGELSTALLIGEIGDFTRFDNANQINAYVGIDINHYQSGEYMRGDHINKRGNPKARMILYFIVRTMIMAQASASNHIVDYYYKLKKQPDPKRDKVAVVACMNKTLKCLFSMIKHKETYSYMHLDSKSAETL